MDAIHDIFVGTRFSTNTNNLVFSVVGINKNKRAVLLCENTGKKFTYGLEGLRRCNITIIEQPALVALNSPRLVINSTFVGYIKTYYQDRTSMCWVFDLYTTNYKHTTAQRIIKIPFYDMKLFTQTAPGMYEVLTFSAFETT